jgi:hypothetical protein
VSHVVTVVSLVTLPVTVTGNRYGDGDRYGDGYGNRYGNGDGYRNVFHVVTVPVSYEVDAHIYNTYN